MFEADLETTLSFLNDGETRKAKYRLEEALKSLRRIKEHEQADKG